MSDLESRRAASERRKQQDPGSENLNLGLPALPLLNRAWLEAVGCFNHLWQPVALHNHPYMDLSEADEILESSSDDTPIEIIREAYQKNFIDGTEEFNKSLFHFLINRLAKQNDTFAGNHALGLLEPRPEETATILKYLVSACPIESLDLQIVELVRFGRIVYFYQIYQIISWFRDNSISPSEKLTDLCRSLCFDAKSPRYLRTICRAFLGDHGTNADLERIALSYDAAETTEHVEIICSIRRLERGRRNAFLARVQDDGEMNRLAARWVESI